MKPLLILLVIVVLLFVVLMVWGARQNDNQKPSSNPNNQKPSTSPKEAADNFQKEIDGGKHNNLDAFNNLLAPFGPALKTSAMIPATTTFDLSIRPSYTTTILADDKHKFRQAHFVVQPTKACAKVVYNAKNTKDDNLRTQESDKTTNKEHPNEFTMTILEGGGTLTVTRVSPTSGICKVELK